MKDHNHTEKRIDDVDAVDLEDQPTGIDPHHDRTDPSEDETVSGSGIAAPTQQHAKLPDQIGGYTIVGLLGEGGMGVVYEAEQERPNRRVALKVMRLGHLVDDVHVKLFHREVETLGRLKHPNIAAIYDSGHTEDGRDFFAMELARGRTLDQWLADRPSMTNEAERRLRLWLFHAICLAVHYAHQRGVIHRDLKPSNIVITEDTTSDSGASSGSSASLPMVKILDFGLARITDADVEATVVTQVGLIKGTLQYMSPEQARGDIDAIDVRTDVYALGVILYELLAGRRPYTVSSTAIAEALRIICEDPPRPLRTRRSGAGPLDLDLETITNKALEKEVEARYDTAAAMAEDVARYLESKPIRARPPSFAYRAHRFVQRNRLGVVAGAVLVVGAVVGVAGIGIGFVRARNAERVARQEAERAGREAQAAGHVTDFLVELFEVPDPGAARGNQVTAREILDRGAERIAAELAEEPRVQSRMAATIGAVYRNLGLYGEAEELLRSSLETRKKLLGDEHPETLESANLLAQLLENQGEYEEAERLFTETLEIRRRLHGETDDALLTSMNNLASLLQRMGEFDRAEALYRQVLEDEGTDSEGLEDSASARVNLALLLQQKGALDEAEALSAEALELVRRSLGDDHPDVAIAINNHGLLLYHKGDIAGALTYFGRALEMNRKLLGDRHKETLNSMSNLAAAMRADGRFDEAEPLYLEALETRREVLGPRHPDVALSWSQLASLYAARGSYRQAAAAFRESLAIFNVALDEEHWMSSAVRSHLGASLTELGRFAEAEQQLEQALAGLESSIGPDHERTLETALRLADLYERWGRPAEAEVYRARVAGDPVRPL